MFNEHRFYTNKSHIVQNMAENEIIYLTKRVFYIITFNAAFLKQEKVVTTYIELKRNVPKQRPCVHSHN